MAANSATQPRHATTIIHSYTSVKMESLLSRILPLAADPFPPTHVAGSEFEGFFLRLESHSGRSHAVHGQASPQLRATTTNKTSKAKPATKHRRESSLSTAAGASPSRIPRLAKSARSPQSASTRRGATQQVKQRRPRSASTTSDSSSHSHNSASSHNDPPSPTPQPRRTSLGRGSLPDGTRSSPTQQPMLTDIDPVFDSPESYLAHPLGLGSSAKPNGLSNGADARGLPAPSPADLILVVCELQSAPIDQRICLYMRWIVHGEEAALFQSLHSPTEQSDRLPRNADKGKRKSIDSFELIRYIPAWQLKLGARASASSVQPFRIDIPSPAGEVDGDSFGFLQVDANGNVVVDVTLPNAARSSGTRRVATRARVRSTKHVPWHPQRSRGMMGSKGPEGWIQHLGAVLPLHWYVHTSSAPAMFSLEHVVQSAPSNSSEELEDAVASGRALLHVEKNWGHGFPSGWMWVHGASPLADPSLPRADAGPAVRLSLAGGSIMGLTAFLVGIHIKPTQGRAVDWNFTPPSAVGPQHASDGPGGEKVHRGIGFTMRRNFKRKTFVLDVWDATRWASISVHGAEETFATQIPGPCRGGWKPAYCHHSYRCQVRIVLFERSLASVLKLPLRAAQPWAAVKALAAFQPLHDGIAWDKVVDVNLDDRVALEFGGDFAQ
ncbi:hypothetical protein L1887_57934 [Cichorium endivia]|nr:hypothetical protein L1887_57934 [Cichorium endivia]